MTNEEKILEMLGTMQEDLTRVNDRLGRLETAQDKMQKDLDTVKTTQAKMEADLDTVKTIQAKMEADLTGVKAHLEVEVDRGIKLLAEGHAGIVEKLKKLDDLEEKLEETSIKVDAIHAATMENIRDITELKRAR